MGSKKQSVIVERTGKIRLEAASLETALIEGIPTLFGRLVYVSEERALLRVPTEVLAEVHREFFYAWLRLSLKEQKRDLLSYFGGMEEQGILCDLRALTMRKIIVDACETLIPLDIADSDFSMFKDRVETILDVRARWPSPSLR